MIGEHGMVSLGRKSPRIARWQQLLKDFRDSSQEPYTPYDAGQVVTMVDNPVATALDLLLSRPCVDIRS